MDESDFEGSIVLEFLARIDKVDEFMEATDYRDTKKAEVLMKQAGIDEEIMTITLKKMVDPYDHH